MDGRVYRSIIVTITMMAAAMSLVIGSVNALASQAAPFSIEINPPRLAFHIGGPPGIYSSDTPVTVSVLSGFAEWTLYCEATPLVETRGRGIISPDRLLIGAQVAVMSEIEQGMIPLSEHPIIGMGSFTGPEPLVIYPLTFGIKTQWEDQPGTYVGSVVFTFLAMP
ncbi:MAG: hypothetical protein ACUVUU_04965 [bacterium]